MYHCKTDCNASTGAFKVLTLIYFKREILTCNFLRTFVYKKSNTGLVFSVWEGL